MKVSHPILITTVFSTIQVRALPAPSDVIEATTGISRRDLWESIGAWFGFGGEDARVVNLGRLECVSDPEWRKVGWCARVGKGFPRDGGATANAMDPESLPAVRNHLMDWVVPPPDPNDLDQLSPGSAREPGDVAAPDSPHGDSESTSGLSGSTVQAAIEYMLRDGTVYTAPPGQSGTWTRADRMSFYNNVCVTDALAAVTEGPPPQAPLLDEAGWQVCDEVEGELFDELDAIDEAREVAESAANKAANGPEFYDPADLLSDDYSPEIIQEWMDHPEFGSPGDVTTENVIQGGYSPKDMKMSGGLGPEIDAPSINTIDFINNGPRWKRGYRRQLRNYRQWVRRKNANGFFDPEATKGINYAFGLENDPILRGPGPEDDPSYVRPTPEEKMIQSMESIASLPFVPLILPDGYDWVPAKRAEFGDNWETVKRFAQMMGRDPLLKAIPTPVKFKMPWGVKGKDFTTRLLGLYGFHGTMITPEIFSNFHWRVQHWLKWGKPKPGDCPWWFRDQVINPTNKGLKMIFPKKSHRYWTLAGIVAATWGIILAMHAKHDKEMKEKGIPYQKWNEPIKEGYGPWLIKESPVTTTIDGTVQVSTLTEYTQYYPGSTVDLSPSEISELLGPMPTTTPATNGEMTAVAAGATAAVTSAAVTSAAMTAAVMTAAAITASVMTPAVMSLGTMIPAAPEYAGIFPLAPSTVSIAFTTTVMAAPSQTLQGPPLNYVEPDRLLAFGVPLNPEDTDIEADDTPSRPDPPMLTSRSSPPFVLPTRRPPYPHPSQELQAAYTNDTYTNGTTAVSNPTDDSETSPSMNSTLHGPYRLNHTDVSFPTRKPSVQKAPHNFTNVGPHRLPNGTSALQSQGLSHGIDGHANGTHGYVNGTHGPLNGTRGYGNGISKPLGKLRYLKGTAPWDGVVVPQVPGAIPMGDGRWTCSWVPSEL